MSGNRDPAWIRFPRWIEESGLPGHLSSSVGLDSWILFRKLIELDCEQNFTPDWFTFAIGSIPFWTGINLESVETGLESLKGAGFILRRDEEYDIQEARIVTPITVPLSEEEIRRQIEGQHAKHAAFILRYAENTDGFESVEQVFYLYQMLFGTKISPKTAQDLEEIANTYDMTLIYQTFSEAFSRNIKSFSWIKTHIGSFDPN